MLAFPTCIRYNQSVGGNSVQLRADSCSENEGGNRLKSNVRSALSSGLGSFLPHLTFFLSTILVEIPNVLMQSKVMKDGYD